MVLTAFESYNLTLYHTNPINIYLQICFSYKCIAFTFIFKESTIAVQFRGAIISNALSPVTMTGSEETAELLSTITAKYN